MRHFETKEHLALAEFYDLLDEIRPKLRNREDGESVPEVFRTFLVGLLRGDSGERAKSSLRFFEFVETSTALYGQFLHFQHQLERVLVDALAEEAGCDEPMLGHRVRGAALVFGVLAVSRHAIATGDVEDYPRQLSAALDFISERLADYDPPAARRSSRRVGRRANRR
jgi:hypothetical protein